MTLISQELLAPFALESSALLDPLAELCLQTRTPFVWEEELKLDRDNTHVKRTYSKAADFCLETDPEWDRTAFSGLRARVCYAGTPNDFDTDARNELKMLGTILHQRISALHKTVVKKRKALRLTRREQETLKWGALGKTSDDIGAIMGLTKRTVDQHFENAARKLGTKSRVQSVVKAYRLDLITI